MQNVPELSWSVVNEVKAAYPLPVPYMDLRLPQNYADILEEMALDRIGMPEKILLWAGGVVMRAYEMQLEHNNDIYNESGTLPPSLDFTYDLYRSMWRSNDPGLRERLSLVQEEDYVFTGLMMHCIRDAGIWLWDDARQMGSLAYVLMKESVPSGNPGNPRLLPYIDFLSRTEGGKEG